MSGHVWLSSIMLDSELVLIFDADIVEEDRPVAVAATDGIPRGQAVTREHCPTSVWPRKGSSKIKDGGKLPPLFVARGYYIVRSDVAEILANYDLGEGALYPVNVLGRDRKPAFDGTWFTWIFGNKKNSADIGQSKNLREFSPVPDDPWRKLPFKPQDGDLAVTDRALEGPDVWVEENLFQSLFLSGPLGDALDSVGLGAALRLTRARIV